MLLSNQELWYLNDLLDGGPIFGVEDCRNGGGDIGRIMKLLTDKQILDCKGTLTSIGTDIVHLLSEYKRTDTYLIMNRVKMALTDRDVMINLYENEERRLYYMTRIPKGEFLYRILKEFSVMRKVFPGRNTFKKQLTYRMWREKEREIEQLYHNSIFFQIHYKGKLAEAKIYYWNDREMCRYDIVRKEFRDCGNSELRQDIFRIIELFHKDRAAKGEKDDNRQEQ